MNKVLSRIQNKLNREKWLESEKQGFDMSGCMPYCKFCNMADHSHQTENGKSYASHYERTINCICAKSKNIMNLKKRSK